MCIAMVCEPGCDVINFEINLIFLIKSFSYMTKKSRQKREYLENETNDNGFLKIQKTLFWGHVAPILSKFGQKFIFLEKRAPSFFKCSNYLSSYKT